MSVVSRSVLFSRLRFYTGVVLFLAQFWQPPVLSNVLHFSLAAKTFNCRLNKFPPPYLQYWSLNSSAWIINVVIHLYSSDQVLRPKCDTVFLFHCRIGFALFECRGTRNKFLWHQQTLWHPVRVCISIEAFRNNSVQSIPMTSLGSKSNIPCSAILWVTDLFPLCVFCSD